MSYLSALYMEERSLRRGLDRPDLEIHHERDCGREPNETLTRSAGACFDAWTAVTDKIDRAEAFGKRSFVEFPDAFIDAGPWNIDAPLQQLDRGGLREVVELLHVNPSGLSAGIRDGRAHLNLTIQFPENNLTIAVDSEDPEVPSGPWVRWNKDDGWQPI